jgi:DNA-binding beta-propeller fold protein YncE
MRTLLASALTATTIAIAGGTAIAGDRPVVDRGAAQMFAKLPHGVRFPEGITANARNGDVFVGTFDFERPNKLLRFSRHGHLEAKRDFGGTPLLGLGFDAGSRKVYVLNFGLSKLQRIGADFDESTPVEDVAVFPAIGAPEPRSAGNPDGSSDTITFGSNRFPAPNAMVFDRSGNLYVSDSFQGAIYRIDDVATCATPCAVAVVKQDPMFATAGFPPFGANGVALDSDEHSLYVANTGDNRILKLDLASGAVSVFAESIHGADGLVADRSGRLWVAANQGDRMVALDSSGRVVAQLGDFEGIGRDGAPDGLLFPASAVIVGSWMYVANLALPLTGSPAEWEADVRRWTISRIRLPTR